MTPRNFDENWSLYENEPDAWQTEADRMGNGWMRSQLFMNALLNLPGTSPHQPSSLSPLDLEAGS